MRDQVLETHGIVEMDAIILSLISFLLNNLTLYTLCAIARGDQRI